MSKQNIICNILTTLKFESKDCLMVGDAKADFEAAFANKVSFLLCKHFGNTKFSQRYNGNYFEDFNDVFII